MTSAMKEGFLQKWARQMLRQLMVKWRDASGRNDAES